MLKNMLSKMKSDFGFLKEDGNEAEQQIMNKLDRSVKLDEVDTITFGLETDDGKIVKVYVKVDDAPEFEKALADKLGEIDDIEEVLNELSKEFEIVDVEWPSEEATGDADEEEDDESDVMNKKVYDNPKEQAETGKGMKPKLEGLSVGEQFTIDINESSHTGSLESRFTTASQLMIYHAILELGIPELALARNPYRAAILKNVKEKALHLANSSMMKNALKTFINRSVDYEEKAQKNMSAMGGHIDINDKHVKESLNEGVTQDFWNAFLELVNYVAASPEDAKDLLASPTMKQIMSRSSASLSSKFTAQLKTKLNDFKNSLSGDGATAQLKAAGVSESYLRATEKLTEGATPDEITSLFKTLLSLADSSKDGSAAANLMKSSAWNSFFNAAKGSLTQKFGGQARAKLNQLKSVLPKDQAAAVAPTTMAAESKKSFAAALKMESSNLKNATLAHDYQYGTEKFSEGHPIEVIGEEGDSYIVKPFPIMANSHMKLKKTAVKLTGKINVPVGGNNGKMDGGLNEEKLEFNDSFRGQSFTKVKNHGTDKSGNTVYSGVHSNKDKKMVANSINDGSCKTIADAEKKAKYAVDNKVLYWDNKDPIKCYNLTHNRPPTLKESQVPEWSFDMDDENVVVQCATLKVILDSEETEKLVKGLTNKDTVIVRDNEDPTHKVAFSPRGSSVMVKKVGTPEGVMMRNTDVDNLLDFLSNGEEEEPEDKEQEAGGDESAVPKDQEKA